MEFQDFIHINRNTVEFKATLFVTPFIIISHINRNTVEFKEKPDMDNVVKIIY